MLSSYSFECVMDGCAGVHTVCPPRVRNGATAVEKGYLMSESIKSQAAWRLSSSKVGYRPCASWNIGQFRDAVLRTEGNHIDKLLEAAFCLFLDPLLHSINAELPRLLIPDRFHQP